MVFFFLIFIVFLVVIAINGDKKGRYTKPAYKTRYFYESDESFIHEDSYYDDYEEFSKDSIYNHIKDGTCSKSDMELLMEDDDINDEFYDEY